MKTFSARASVLALLSIVVLAFLFVVFSLPRLVKGAIMGFHDTNHPDISCTVRGWAIDPSFPTTPLTILIYNDATGVKIAETKADKFREDLLNAGACPGLGGSCSFQHTLSLAAGTYSIRAKGAIGLTEKDLTNTPRDLTCTGSSPAAPTCTVTGPSSVEPGEDFIISWASTNAVSAGSDWKDAANGAFTPLRLPDDTFLGGCTSCLGPSGSWGSVDTSTGETIGVHKNAGDNPSFLTMTVFGSSGTTGQCTYQVSVSGTTPGGSTGSPEGFLEGINTAGVAAGWAADPDVLNNAINVHFYVDGPEGTGVWAGAVTTNVSRNDVNSFLSNKYGTTVIGNHGFNFTIPDVSPADLNYTFRDGTEHTLYAHGIDKSGGQANVLLPCVSGVSCVNGTGMKFTLGGSTGSGTVTVAKTYLEVAPTDTNTQVKLDSGTLTSGNPVVFSNVSAGTHTLTIEVPVNTKAFYAICTDAMSCNGDFVDVGIGSGIGSTVRTITTTSFTHTEGQNDFIQIIFASTNAFLSEVMEPISLVKSVSATSATSMIPVDFKWANLFLGFLPIQDCSRLLYIADKTSDQGTSDGMDDFYTVTVSGISEWDSLTVLEPKPASDGNPAGTATYLPTGGKLLNGILSYPIKNYSDGRNLIGYSTEDFTKHPFTGEATDHVGRTYTRSLVIGFTTYSLQTDVAINPLILSVDFITAILHELGHVAGLAHPLVSSETVSSIMHEGEESSGFITGNDVAAINEAYPNCTQSPPTKSIEASLSITFNPNPAPFVDGLGETYCNDSPVYWLTDITVAETNGVGVTMGNVTLDYFDTSGNFLRTFVFPFSDEFVTNTLAPGGSITQTKCQDPWFDDGALVPLGSTRWRINGTDDNGNFVEGEGTINLQNIFPSSSQASRAQEYFQSRQISASKNKVATRKLAQGTGITSSSLLPAMQDPPYTRYGASYDVFSPSKAPIIKAFVGPSFADVVVGTGSPRQFIYNTGYVWKNGTWEKINFAGSRQVKDRNGNFLPWFAGSASASFAVSPSELGNDNYVAAYMCTRRGREWRCGCRDSTCATKHWQLQIFKKP